MVFIWRWAGFGNLQWAFALSRSITKQTWWRLWCQPSPLSVLMCVHGFEIPLGLVDLHVLDPHSQSVWLNSHSSCIEQCVYLMFCWLEGPSSEGDRCRGVFVLVMTSWTSGSAFGSTAAGAAFTRGQRQNDQYRSHRGATLRLRFTDVSASSTWLQSLR